MTVELVKFSFRYKRTKRLMQKGQEVRKALEDKFGCLASCITVKESHISGYFIAPECDSLKRWMAVLEEFLQKYYGLNDIRNEEAESVLIPDWKNEYSLDEELCKEYFRNPYFVPVDDNGKSI